MNGQGNGAVHQQRSANVRKTLSISPSGLQYIYSPEYLDYMTELVAREYGLDGSFFGLLVGVTAAFLSDTDPNAEDTEVFDQFVSKNMSVIREAIDRVKTVIPEITLAEQSWEQTSLNDHSCRSAPSRTK